MPKIPKSLKDILLAAKFEERPIKTNPSILLHGQIPKPMHGVAPRVVLGQAWWNRERKAAYLSTDNHCEACGISKYDAEYKKWMEAHEVYEIDYVKGTMTYLRAAPLCHYCHAYIHAGRLQMLLDQGKINHYKFASIIQHGEKILKLSGLSRPQPYSGPIASWSKWRMIVNGKKYKPKFKNEKEWIKGHDL